MIRENQVFLNRLNIVLDGVWVCLSFLLGYWIRFYVLPGGIQSLPFQAYLAVSLALIPLHLLSYGIAGLYDSQRKRRLYQELGRLFLLNALDFIILQMTFFLLKDIHFSRLALGLFFLLLNTGLTVKRIILRKFLHHLRSLGYNQKRVLLVGGGNVNSQYITEIRRSPELGYQILGYEIGRAHV